MPPVDAKSTNGRSKPLPYNTAAVGCGIRTMDRRDAGPYTAFVRRHEWHIVRCSRFFMSTRDFDKTSGVYVGAIHESPHRIHRTDRKGSFVNDPFFICKIPQHLANFIKIY